MHTLTLLFSLSVVFAHIHFSSLLAVHISTHIFLSSQLCLQHWAVVLRSARLAVALSETLFLKPTAVSKLVRSCIYIYIHIYIYLENSLPPIFVWMGIFIAHRFCNLSCETSSTGSSFDECDLVWWVLIAQDWAWLIFIAYGGGVWSFVIEHNWLGLHKLDCHRWWLDSKDCDYIKLIAMDCVWKCFNIITSRYIGHGGKISHCSYCWLTNCIQSKNEWIPIESDWLDNAFSRFNFFSNFILIDLAVSCLSFPSGRDLLSWICILFDPTDLAFDWIMLFWNSICWHGIDYAA